MAKMGGEGDGDYRIPYVGAELCAELCALYRYGNERKEIRCVQRIDQQGTFYRPVARTNYRNVLESE